MYFSESLKAELKLVIMILILDHQLMPPPPSDCTHIQMVECIVADKIEQLQKEKGHRGELFVLGLDVVHKVHQRIVPLEFVPRCVVPCKHHKEGKAQSASGVEKEETLECVKESMFSGVMSTDADVLFGELVVAAAVLGDGK